MAGMKFILGWQCLALGYANSCGLGDTLGLCRHLSVILGTGLPQPACRQDLGPQAGEVILAESRFPHLPSGRTPGICGGPGEQYEIVWKEAAKARF